MFENTQQSQVKWFNPGAAFVASTLHLHCIPTTTTTKQAQHKTHVQNIINSNSSLLKSLRQHKNRLSIIPTQTRCAGPGLTLCLCLQLHNPVCVSWGCDGCHRTIKFCIRRWKIIRLKLQLSIGRWGCIVVREAGWCYWHPVAITVLPW